MKLAKAIEIGELNIKEAGKKMPPDVLDTLKILVEAAKRIEENRSLRYPISLELLPGEDKE